MTVTPDGSKVYVTEGGQFSRGPNPAVSVIDTATNTVIATIPVGSFSSFAAVTPDGSKVYVTTTDTSSVTVIDTATNAVLSVISVGIHPFGVAVSPDGSKVYVANRWAASVTVIDTGTDTVVGPPIPVGLLPTGFGLFIQPVISPPATALLEIVGVSASSNVLWPPNNKLVDVTLNYRAFDSSGQAPMCGLSATSNDRPSDATDVEIVNPHHVKLRASKASRGRERVYVVVITCHSASGQTATAQTTVTVPHSRGR